MKYLLNIIAGLLIIIWIMVFKPSEAIHLLLVVAALILIITNIFDKNLSGKSNITHNQ